MYVLHNNSNIITDIKMFIKISNYLTTGIQRATDLYVNNIQILV